MRTGLGLLALLAACTLVGTAAGGTRPAFSNTPLIATAPLRPVTTTVAPATAGGVYSRGAVDVSGTEVTTERSPAGRYSPK